MREKQRTETDFSKHEFTGTLQKDLAIYTLAIPRTHMKSVVFINTQGIMAVTGDYGNWIFCREFHPGPDEDVSDMYWMQKLRIASTQEPCNFETAEAQRQIDELQKNPDYDFSEEEKEWLKELYWAADDGEYSYIAKAMDRPSSFESEMIPKGKVTNYWLLVIFDAFDEICKRMKTCTAEDHMAKGKEHPVKCAKCGNTFVSG